MRIMTTATSALTPAPSNTPLHSLTTNPKLHMHTSQHTHAPNPAVNVKSSISTADTQPPPSAAFEA